MTTIATEHFDRQYQTHLKHLKLKGLQPKTIDAYSRAIRRVGDYFYRRIDTLTEAQLTDYILGLRLGEGLRLQVSDIDAAHGHVHIRNAKGNRDRLVPLPQATHQLLRRFCTHYNFGTSVKKTGSPLNQRDSADSSKRASSTARPSS